MITAGDFLAGGGGVTEALSKIDNVQVKFVLNHSIKAIRTNMFHHKKVKHYLADIYKQDEHVMEHVDFAWCSVECDQHSRARGKKKKNLGSYMLAWELLRYIKHIDPACIGIENVPEFKKWSPVDSEGEPIKELEGQEFNKWRDSICSLGYDYSEQIREAADDGLPTRRKRYFAFFTKKELGIIINWPEPTHNRYGTHGKKKWEACGPYINLENEGESIFGRKYNSNIKRQHRRELVPNSRKRIAGGIKKHDPDLAFILQYYSTGLNSNSLNEPLPPITSKDRHLLVQIKKTQLIDEHVQQDIFNTIDEPLSPVLTRQTKRLITIEKAKFVVDYYTRDVAGHGIDEPSSTITTENRKILITSSKKQFIQHSFGKSMEHGIDEPMRALTTKEKVQFITTYFSSGKNQHTQHHGIDVPLNAITTSPNKHALVTAFANGEIDFDFDIKSRFLEPDELASISTFPAGYFTHRDLKLSKKAAITLIGNAVPPAWAKIIIEPVVKQLDEKLNQLKTQVA